MVSAIRVQHEWGIGVNLGLRVITVAILLMIVPGLCLAESVIVVASETPLRAQPGEGKKVVATLARFTPVTIEKQKGDWTQVSVSKMSGWVRSSALGTSCFVSVGTKKANCREGPGSKHSVRYNFAYGYPLQVLEKSGDWVRVKDWEGDGGWMHVSQLSTERFVIVRPKEVNVRSGPGTENKIVFKAEHGVVLKLLGTLKDWLKVKHEDGDEGWIAANLVWGNSDQSF